MASAIERKKQKSRVEKFLRIEGIDYDEWLEAQHKEVIEKNQAFIDSAVDKALEEKLQEAKRTNTNSNNANY